MRNKLNCLKTDYKELMKQIEEGMISLHSQYKKEKEKNKQITTELTQNKETIQITEVEKKPVKKRKTPFLNVNSIAEGSPAEESGLQVKDEISQFGEIEKKDIDTYGLKILSDYVQRNVNQKIKITITRKYQEMELEFIPKVWSGKGLLGCHIVPIK
jgi:26S proteasome regulatory subunit N4